MNLTTTFSSQSFSAFFVDEYNDYWVWGCNRQGSLGLGHTEDQAIPERLDFPHEVVNVALGYNHMMVLTKEGQVFVWGGNSDGRLGTGEVSINNVLRPTPLSFPNDEHVTALFAGADHSLAITREGSLFVWGENAYYQLGLGDQDKRTSPTRLLLPGGAVATVAHGGIYHSMAGDSKGNIFFWGDCGGSFQTPKHIIQLESEVVQFSAGIFHSIALTKDGKVYAWGYNNTGQLGLGADGSTRDHPTLLDLGVRIQGIAGGFGFCFALAENSEIFCWGSNGDGQLGIGTEETIVMTARKINFPSEFAVRAILAGAYHTFFLTEDGSLWSCGYGMNGRLGHGSMNEMVKVPKKVEGSWRWKVPRSLWAGLFFWFFLGRADPGSCLSVLPVEVVFHLVTVLRR
jgi:alpha-tubulin suppressor-like RCC1 family protein